MRRFRNTFYNVETIKLTKCLQNRKIGMMATQRSRMYHVFILNRGDFTFIEQSLYFEN